LLIIFGSLKLIGITGFFAKQSVKCLYKKKPVAKPAQIFKPQVI
jgi:hypothetical protein